MVTCNNLNNHFLLSNVKMQWSQVKINLLIDIFIMECKKQFIDLRLILHIKNL
jgi:hypothetical protein